MKKLFLILFILVPLVCHAALPTILGIQFGSSYEYTKTILDNRLNSGNSSYQASKGELNYYDVTIGGIFYKVANFEFTNVNGVYKLTYAFLYSHYNLNELTTAKNDRDYIKSIYSQKYNLTTSKNQSGFNYYHATFVDDEEFLYMKIHLYKGKNRGGETKYFSGVSYSYESSYIIEKTLDEI